MVTFLFKNTDTEAENLFCFIFFWQWSCQQYMIVFAFPSALTFFFFSKGTLEEFRYILQVEEDLYCSSGLVSHTGFFHF